MKNLSTRFDVLEEHFSPQTSEIAKRNVFHKRNQKVEESVSDFVADLHRDEELQLRLFFRKNLTFESALEEALSAETAVQHTREVGASDNTSSNIFPIQARTAKQATICQSCGGSNIRSQKRCMSKSWAYGKRRKVRLEPINLKLATFKGEVIKVKGSCLANVQYGNIYRTLTLIVAKGHCPNLLGLNWCEFTENNGSPNPVILVGCSLWGSRVIIQLQARLKILKEWHVGHPGIVRMKALARGYVWWPKLDSEIRNLIRTCELCQQSRAWPSHMPVYKWESARIPWSRIHLDLAGPSCSNNFLVVVDAFCKRLEVSVLKNTTFESMISCLRQIFGMYELPGTQFTSQVFQKYLNKSGIKHITSSPFHSSSNGQAERMVRTTKESLKKMRYNVTGITTCTTTCLTATTESLMYTEVISRKKLKNTTEDFSTKIPERIPEKSILR
ncbi:Uncharacterized protein TPS_01376 [Trichinella pseudospiralis]